jgi:DNA/RNA-binding domain of Phe-tRNA-synthetase-like protein
VVVVAAAAAVVVVVVVEVVVVAVHLVDEVVADAVVVDDVAVEEEVLAVEASEAFLDEDAVVAFRDAFQGTFLAQVELNLVASSSAAAGPSLK